MTVVNGFQSFTIFIKNSILDIAAVLHPPLLIIYLLLTVNHCRNPSVLHFSFARLLRKTVVSKQKIFQKSETALFEQIFSKIIREKRAQKSNSKNVREKLLT